ncbi:ALP1-like protein [Tanacetum coccineum]
MHEAARKYVERTFGILKKRWAILATPARAYIKEKLANIMYTCIILHNMIIKDRKEAISPHWYPKEEHKPDDLIRSDEQRYRIIRGYNIGIRLIDEFLAKSNVTRCVDLRETAEIIAKDVPLAMIQKYLRMKADFATKFCIEALKVYETSAMNQEILERKRAQLDNQNYEEKNSSFSSRQFQSKSGDFKQEFGELKKYRAFVFKYSFYPQLIQNIKVYAILLCTRRLLQTWRGGDLKR